MIFTNWVDSEKEKQEILELTKKTFGDSDISDSSYFDWQYLENPNGKATVLIAKDDKNDNKIIGTNAIIKTSLLIDGEETFSFLACNAQVDSDYRKKGIFLNLLKSTSNTSSNQGISSIFAFPNQNSFNSYIKEGANKITSLPLLVRPIKFSQYFSTPLNIIFQPFDGIWKKQDRFSDIEHFKDDFDDSFETLTKKASNRISVIGSRKKHFLTWRYRKHPTRKYDVFILKEKNELIGYIITKIHFIQNHKIGVIVDFMVDSNFEDVKKLKNLIDKSISFFWEQDVSVAITTCNKNLIENKLLKKSGFKILPSYMKPEPLNFMIRITGNDKKHLKLNNFENWFFTFGDYDIF